MNIAITGRESLANQAQIEAMLRGVMADRLPTGINKNDVPWRRYAMLARGAALRGAARGGATKVSAEDIFSVIFSWALSTLARLNRAAATPSSLK